MTTWIQDNNGNRCSVEYWGSKEAAQKALDSLKDCSYCSECSECSRCSKCSYCFYCSYCSDCSECSYCSECSECSRCSRCSRCSYCFYCSGSSYCSKCSYCSGKDMGNKIEIPVIANIHRVVYDSVSQPNALEMSSVHSCETTHCRAGWVVTLAGEAGRKLENFYNWELAAMLIYEKSGYAISPCRFYDSNADALADMKRLAEMEVK